MAIISIPSSIGGVNIPGALVKGPLGALFGSKYKKDFLQYPSDLGSATKGHVVQFSVNEVDPIHYINEKADKFTPESNIITDNVQKALDAVESFKKSAETINMRLQSRKKKSATTISLYIPDTVDFPYAVSYGNLSLANVIKEVSGVAGKALSDAGGGTNAKGIDASPLNKYGRLLSAGTSFAGSETAKLLLSSQGLAINPNEQVLFDGIDFRPYQMAFTFTPYTKQEAETVKKIIKAFRTAAAPQISSTGMFFIPPSTLDVEFLFNGKRNDNITRVAESVITSIDVNYSPNGWAAHDDGAPVQTTMTIGFKEIELIDKTRINQGY
jgi:hypothetical protein